MTERSFVLMRHSKKNQEGNISAEGRALAHKEAENIFKSIVDLPVGSLVCFIPSNIGRARETKNIIENEISKQIEIQPNDFQKAKLGQDNILEIAQANPDKKILLQTTFYDSRIGFSSDRDYPSNKAFMKYSRLFNGDENYVGRVWLARRDELEGLNNELRVTFNKDIKIRPADFGITPEESVIIFLEWLQAIKNVADKNFPNRPINIFGISHNMQNDFVSMALLKLPISINSLNMLGGNFRDYLESSRINITDEGLEVIFRNKKGKITNQNIDQIIEELHKESDQRKKEWQKYD